MKNYRITEARNYIKIIFNYNKSYMNLIKNPVL